MSDIFKQLPIRRRGNFLKDEFFKDFQDDFDSAIQNVMGRHTGRSLLADQFSNYRKLRAGSDETGPAASVSETSQATIIVLDMSDFVKGSIAVRTRGRYAVVEASFESKSFNRKFPLPRNTNFEGLITAMSNEGILTITAPKKSFTKSPGETNPEAASGEASLKMDAGEPENLGGISSEEVANGGEDNQSPPLSPSVTDRDLSISKKGNFFQDEYFQNVWKDFETAIDEMVQKDESTRAQKRDQRLQEKEELVNKFKSEMMLDSERKKGRTQERESLSELLIPKFSRMNSYRNLRSWAPESETQALTITQDANGYKIVMDVKNFGNSEGDVSIMASEGHLAVTGHKGQMTTTKEFTLKGLTDPDQVNASVSEDGILTVTVTVPV